MIIDKVEIKKFRGFEDTEFSLGSIITLIAGQNGTQKSTLLGMLTQTFSIAKEHPFHLEKPLTGGTYKSAFQDKFRLSPTLDKPGEHEWAILFHNKKLHKDLDKEGRFTIQSIPRQKNQGIRFWQKGTKGAGSGYIQLPVIFLSLKRLIPLAEAGKVEQVNIDLTEEEKKWFSEKYNEILINSDVHSEIQYLVSKNKNTLGVSTRYYDWNSNSAGQDNVGRILLALISFKRLKEKYSIDYNGGILAIDELDATLYPASQVMLLKKLSSICARLSVQVIATTHSIHAIEEIISAKNIKGRANQFNVVFLNKMDNKVIIDETPSLTEIMNNLKVQISGVLPQTKIPIYTEDEECRHFLKAILGRKYSNLNYVKITLGCGNLIQLGQKKVPSFTFPNSIVVLDGDAKKDLKNKKLKNYICLPGDLSPERMLANYLFNLSDGDSFWKVKNPSYSKQICFKEYKFEDICSDRDKAKKWYQEQLAYNVWGREASLAFKELLKNNTELKEDFIFRFNVIYQLVRSMK